ncbi:MAG TPA: hypothetical protein PLD84_07255, partial [Chitinophagales bacterium]|nr:hypothetical protein [Chitinophagales bacterium]
MKLKSCFLLLPAFLISTIASAQSMDTLFYAVVKGGEISGIQKMWMAGEQEYHFFYKYNDRGRGDSVYSQINTNTTGQITNVTVEGVDYFKNAYRESFVVQGDSAISQVNAERNVKPFKNEIYFGQASPGFIEPVIKFLLRQPNQKATVFNGGNLQLMPLIEKRIASNKVLFTFYLCEMYFNENTPPFYVWLDKDKHFFANVNDWFSIIQRGYESMTDTLNTLQEIQSKNYYGKQMKSLSEPLPLQFAVTRVRLY